MLGKLELTPPKRIKIFNSYLTLHTKSNAKWIKHINIKAKNIKLIEENNEYPIAFFMEMNFWIQHQMHQAKKAILKVFHPNTPKHNLEYTTKLRANPKDF